MRIGIDARTLYIPALKGIGIYLYNLLINISEIDQENEYFLYYDSRQENFPRFPKAANFIEKGISIKKGDRFYFWEQIRLPLEIRRDKIDIFHSPGNITPFSLGCPILVTVHDTTLQEVSRGNIFNKFYYKKLQPAKLRKVKKIITGSNYSKERISTVMKVPIEKIIVIPNGISDLFRVLRDRKSIEQVKQKYGISGEYILNVGGESPWKNVSRLIKAYSILADNSDYKKQLVITGIRKKEILDKHMKEIFEYGVSEKVLVLGYIPENDLINLYNGADVFVYPSLREGFGFPPLEAMACGVPVIASNKTSIPEVVGNAALLVDAENPQAIADEILNVTSNYPLRQKLLQAGSMQYSNYKWEKTAAETLKLYKQLFNEQ